MKLLRLCPFLIVGALASGQDNSDLFEKAPPPIDEALRARVAQFYHAYTTGKFREAYPLVAEDCRMLFSLHQKTRSRTARFFEFDTRIISQMRMSLKGARASGIITE